MTDIEIRQLIGKIGRVFWIGVIVNALILLSVYIYQSRGSDIALAGDAIWIIGVVLLIAVAGIGVAAPILLRTFFLAQTAKEQRFSRRKYESLLVWTSILPMIAAALASLSYLLLVPKWHLYATVLFALYAVYSAIPAKKKIHGELNYFGNRLE